MIQVRSLASASFETPDIERQTSYYSDILGLSVVEKDTKATYLSAINDHHSMVLRQGSESRLTSLSFQISPQGDLDEFERQLTGLGVKTTRKSDSEPSLPHVVSFQDPKGTTINVFRDRSVSSQRSADKGVMPLKLGHVSFNTPDAPGIADFYCKTLGFRISDQIEDYFLFLRCGPDHHTVNFIESPRAKMHHVAFELRDPMHVMTACDFLGHNNYPLIWGPGRHVRGHNIFTYHRNPDGQIVELFTQLDQILDEEKGYFEPQPWHANNPHRPQRWPRDLASTNLWGIMPPPGFMD